MMTLYYAIQSFFLHVFNTITAVGAALQPMTKLLRRPLLRWGGRLNPATKHQLADYNAPTRYKLADYKSVTGY